MWNVGSSPSAACLLYAVIVSTSAPAGMPRPDSISSIVSQPSTSGWKPYAGSRIVSESRISQAVWSGWSKTNADIREW